MCRLMGMSLGNTPEELDAGEIASILMPALVQGGPHAYGWMTYRDGDLMIQHAKFPGRSDTDAAWDNIMNGVDPKARWFVGHTRYATHGSPSDNRNNHPLRHGNIMGVHNGVLANHDKILSVTGRDDPKTEVDSEAIFAAVNRWGPSEGLRRVEGAMVTIYANVTRPHILHIGRSSGRSLTIGFTKKGNLIWASDPIALLKLEPEVEFVRLSKVSENRLLLVRNGKIIQRYRYRPLPPKKKAPARTAGDLVLSQTARERFDSFDVVDSLQQRRASKRGELIFGNRKPEKVPEMVYWEGHFITEEEYERIREDG